jgi:hypothetical protein
LRPGRSRRWGAASHQYSPLQPLLLRQLLPQPKLLAVKRCRKTGGQLLLLLLLPQLLLLMM